MRPIIFPLSLSALVVALCHLSIFQSLYNITSSWGAILISAPDITSLISSRTNDKIGNFTQKILQQFQLNFHGRSEITKRPVQLIKQNFWI